MPSVLLPLVLVALAIATMAAAVVWAWWHGTLHPSEQERIDLEFERLVRRSDGGGRAL